MSIFYIYIYIYCEESHNFITVQTNRAFLHMYKIPVDADSLIKVNIHLKLQRILFLLCIKALANEITI